MGETVSDTERGKSLAEDLIWIGRRGWPSVADIPLEYAFELTHL